MCFLSLQEKLIEAVRLFELRRFGPVTDRYINFIICKQCKVLMAQPFVLNECRHAMCRDCVREFRNCSPSDRKCPQCNTPLSTEPSFSRVLQEKARCIIDLYNKKYPELSIARHEYMRPPPIFKILLTDNDIEPLEPIYKSEEGTYRCFYCRGVINLEGECIKCGKIYDFVIEKVDDIIENHVIEPAIEAVEAEIEMRVTNWHPQFHLLETYEDIWYQFSRFVDYIQFENPDNMRSLTSAPSEVPVFHDYTFDHTNPTMEVRRRIRQVIRWESWYLGWQQMVLTWNVFLRDSNPFYFKEDGNRCGEGARELFYEFLAKGLRSRRVTFEIGEERAHAWEVMFESSNYFALTGPRVNLPTILRWSKLPAFLNEENESLYEFVDTY